MPKKSATGIDTRAMIPVYTAVFFIWSLWGRAWIMVPSLRNSKMKFTALTVETKEWLTTTLTILQKKMVGNLSFEMVEFWTNLHFILSLVISLVLIVACIFLFKKREKCVGFVRGAYVLGVLFSGFQLFMVFAGDGILNGLLQRENTFRTLTIEGLYLPTSWVYARLLLSIFMVAAAERLLVFKEIIPETYVERTMKEDKKIGKRTKVTALLILIVIPLVIAFGIFFLDSRSNVFIGFCIAGLAMIPFFMVFEDRKPQARELILIAVMAAIAVVGRMAFFMLPQFKPVTAVVIIAGVGLGAEAGFLTGALAGFVSNFFFGQGPWTPWQMLAFGIIGFLAGLLFRKKKRKGHRLLLCIYGGIATFVIYGFIMDTSSVLQFSEGLSGTLLWSTYLTGIPFNFVHGVSTIIFLYVLAEPMEKKLNRIKKKYGILE